MLKIQLYFGILFCYGPSQDLGRLCTATPPQAGAAEPPRLFGKALLLFFLRGGSRCTQGRFRKNVPQGVRHFLLSSQKFCPTRWGIGALLFIGVERTGGAVKLSISVQSFLRKRMCSCCFFNCLDRLDQMYFIFSILITFALG